MNWTFNSYTDEYQSDCGYSILISHGTLIAKDKYTLDDAEDWTVIYSLKQGEVVISEAWTLWGIYTNIDNDTVVKLLQEIAEKVESRKK